MNSVVRINRKGADRLQSGHPWIFSSDVTDRGTAQPGEVVRVTDQKGRGLGTAHYSSTSQITLRMLSSRVEEVTGEWLRGKLEAALAFRNRVVRDSDAYRLVYSEADGLPGLIVDRYGDALSIQILSQGMDRLQPLILEQLQQMLAPRVVVLRNDSNVRKHENLAQEKLVAVGELDGPVSLRMNGLAFQADLLGGQKTGVFLDQRENYAAAARHAHGRALDCFTCTGGFALHMARSCESVDAVDSSEQSLKTAECNRRANGVENVEWREADVFDLLASYSQAKRRYSTIVLDPPAFAKTREAREGALRGYKEINQRALRMLGSGGILITCSCSHHVSEAMLLEVIAQAGLDAGKTLRVLERRAQSADHPVLLTVPETLYLKLIILEVV